MHDLIRRIAEWVSLLLGPGPGIHRRSPRHASPSRRRQWNANHVHTAAPVRTSLTAVPAPDRPPASRPLPGLRSPYGEAARTPVDATAPAPVRPYVVAHERERAHEHARQRRRRVALVLAADFGVDLDRHLVGAADGLYGTKVAA